MVTKGDVKPTMAAPILGEHPCEFIRGSCVKTTRLGPALVVRFRPEDGIYQVYDLTVFFTELLPSGVVTRAIGRGREVLYGIYLDPEGFLPPRAGDRHIMKLWIKPFFGLSLPKRVGLCCFFPRCSVPLCTHSNIARF